MQALRQLGSGVIIAIFSVILVVGGIFLSLAETLPAPATPTQIPPTFPQSFPTPTATIIQTLQTETPTATVTPTLQTETKTETSSPSPASTSLPPALASCTPPSGWIRITTATGDTIYSIAQRYKTSADSLSTANCLSSLDIPAGQILYVPPVPTVTVIPCGPPASWVKTHIVQPGDNLYRIALSYGITYPQLQRANCMGNSTAIYTGQRLRVPNIPPRTPVPGVTSVPNFPTETQLPATTIPPTATEPPPATATSVATATEIQTTPVTPLPP